MYVRDTALVQILCSAGVGRGTAVRTERFLDDAGRGVLSADSIADAILRYSRGVAFTAIRNYEEASPEIRHETERRLDLFESSAYGVFSPRKYNEPPGAVGTSSDQ